MKFKLIALLTVIAFTFSSCGGEKKEAKPSKKQPVKKEVQKEEVKVDASKIDLMAPTLDNKGIGPIKNITLGDIDQGMVAKGKEVYKTNCTACHKFKKRYIGPALKGITGRRSPEWIMNMILNSDEMLKKDPVAKALITEYNAPMAQQQISVEEARSIVEYFRTKN
ncbi:MAG: cytochrome C [Lutibacter sp.]|nr:MAG: cytochrome C [Lutibacter sp.]